MDTSLMRRLVAILHDHPGSIYTVSQFKESIEEVSGDKCPRNTYSVYLRRLCVNGIAEKLRTDKRREPAYRCASTFKAKSYLEGHYQDYPPGMTPIDPPIRPSDSVRHRVVYKLQLSNSELGRVQGVGAWERFGRSPGYWRVNDKDFSLRAWSSGKARIFLKDDWRSGVQQLFGTDLVQQVELGIANGNGHVGYARKPQIDTPNLPVGNIFRVVSPEGKVSIFQYGFSQIQTGELDRHGPENEPYADMLEKWLFDELKFKSDMVNKLSSLDRTLGSLPDMIGKAVADSIKKAFETTNKPEPEYKPPATNKGDYAYG